MDVFDHNPTWIRSKEINWGPKPFKFFTSWIDHHDFFLFFKSVWDSNMVVGNGAFVLKEKLKHLKDHKRLWNMPVFVP